MTRKNSRRPRKQPSPKISIAHQQSEEGEEAFVELSDEEDEPNPTKTDGEEKVKEENQNTAKQSRQSERQRKKPDRFGHNIMISNIAANDNKPKRSPNP